MSVKVLSTAFGIAASAFAVNMAQAAVIVQFDSASEIHPFRPAVLDGKTSLSGSFVDPDFNDGTSFTLTLSNPVKSVNVSTPSSPDFSSASASFFGAEESGFGVGDTGLGRFTTGEAFTLTTTHAMTINSFVFHEWNGDEYLHISWVQGGVAKSNVFSMADGTGTAPANITVALSGIQVDANSDIVITNVSPSGANSSGRLRIRKMEVALVPEPAALSFLGLGGLALLRRRRA